MTRLRIGGTGHLDRQSVVVDVALETVVRARSSLTLSRAQWSGGPGRAGELVEVLAAYLALRERHHAALTALQPRLAALLATPAHDHLEPIERWLVRTRILAAPATT